MPPSRGGPSATTDCDLEDPSITTLRECWAVYALYAHDLRGTITPSARNVIAQRRARLSVLNCSINSSYPTEANPDHTTANSTMIDAKRIERNITETAYCLKVLGYYDGTESKALSAVRKRKGMDGLDRQSAADALSVALGLLDRTQTLGKSVLQQANRNYHPQLSREQFDAGTTFIREHLAKEFPASTLSIEYMMAMLWHMPYVR